MDFYNNRDALAKCSEDFFSNIDAQKQKCWPQPEIELNVNKVDMGKLNLSEEEINDLLAYLATLDDGWKPEDFSHL